MQVEPKQPEQLQPKNTFQFTLLDGLRSDLSISYPYYPVASVIDHGRGIVLAVRMKELVNCYHISDRIDMVYTLNFDQMPKISITYLLLQPAEQFQVVRKDETPPMYLFVGYANGLLLLVKFVRRQIKVIYRYNRVVLPEPGLLSRTFSYFNQSNPNDYAVWQRSSVLKIIKLKQNLIYLLSNSTIVNLNNFTIPADKLQTKMEIVSKSSNLKKNTLEKGDGFTYFINREWKMAKNTEGTAFSFESTVSAIVANEDALFVGNFQGDFYIFDMASAVCLQKINIRVAIRQLSLKDKFVGLSLYDDTAYIVDLSRSVFATISGHKSFISQIAMLDKDSVVCCSFDGKISHSLLSPSDWFELKNLNLHRDKAHLIDETYDLGQLQAGYGSMLVHRSYCIVQSMDSYIRIYNFQKKN